jgi:hypothetical protein
MRQAAMLDSHICSICFRPFGGWGNSAQPVNNGRACYECTSYIVIPAKIRMMRQRREQTNEKGVETNG